MAEEQMLTTVLLTNPPRPPNDHHTLTTSQSDGTLHLSIIQALAYTIPEYCTQNIGQLLADKFADLVQWLRNLPPANGNPHARTEAALEMDTQLSYISFW